MRLTVFTALAAFAFGVSAQTPFTVTSDSITSALQLNAINYFNSPLPPWKAGSKPGWHYGSSTPTGILCLKDKNICQLLDLLGLLNHPGCLHHCPHPPPPPPPPPPHKPPPPPPPPKYTPTYSNLTCASQDDSSFMTFGLVDTVADCEAMCDAVPGCTFVNSYHDNNDAGKGDSPLLTCSLFSKCLTAASADNCAGQGQPNGGVDFITESSGFCKKVPTSS
ncbi:hypothetical protein C8F01DRAFT_1374597 [Mycena amicta]|nr:hypothetical protein C8F01DRAFT_1374597 [Mycena amicta]